MPPMGEDGRPQMPSMSGNATPTAQQANQSATADNGKAMSDTERITAEINARKQVDAQKQAEAPRQEQSNPIPPQANTLKPSAGSTKKSSKARVFIIIAVVIIAVIVLGSCMLRSCAKKVSNAISNGITNSGTVSNANLTPSQSGFSWTNLSNNYYTEDSWEDNSGSVVTSVAEGVPEKRTEIIGNGKDTVTIMVYICAADLESENGAATSDIMEMLKADIGSNVNLVLFTGGTRKWQNNAISSDYNQIYQIKDGELFRLEKNFGNKTMTKPDTLAEFIQYCGKKFPANRNMLILWDHGGGSVEGYGYDEKNANSGAMNLAAIKSALKKGGETFDIIGFDACLMATVETGLTLSDYADYMIASEETEDSTGWYYTGWLNELGNNTSIASVDLGKVIADDFVRTTSQNSPGIGSTLSVTDLAELSTTVPAKMQAFGKKVSAQIDREGNNDDSYSTVAKARSKSREFGESYQTDQVDAVDFAKKLGTDEGMAFADAVLGAVKYNKVSRNMTNAYGLSIYFPYSNYQYASAVGSVYEAIGICSEYSDAVQKYASLEMSGQYLSGGGSAFNSLFGIFGSGDYGNDYYGNEYNGNDYSSLFNINDLLGNDGSYGNSYSSNYSSNFFGGYDYDNYNTDYSSSDMSDLLGSLLGGGLFSERSYVSKMNTEKASEFLAENIFDQRQLEWKKNKKGQQVISMDDHQWNMVDHILLNMYYDDGNGLIDLGTDNVFSFDEEGNMVGENDKTWLSIDGNIVAYYYESTVSGKEEYTITGYVPVLYKGRTAKLMLVFDNENPYGYIAGLRYDNFQNGQSIGVVPKVINGVQTKTTSNTQEGLWENSFIPENVTTSIKEGDQIDFIADYYDYGGNYVDSYVIGSWTASTNPEIANIDVGDGTVLAMYSFTDIYNQTYWTAAME